MTTLVDKVLMLTDALTKARIPHAFGGALALAYYTEDPRGTRDIDVNTFVPATDSQPLLDALPAGIAIPTGTVDRLASDGQIRLWWQDTPVDLFLDYAPLHARAARNVRDVPFAGATIRILGPVELILFKALFDRPKDWVDIAAVVEADAVDTRAARRELASLVGPDDPRLVKWDALRSGS
jgi:hypothetical protein